MDQNNITNHVEDVFRENNARFSSHDEEDLIDKRLENLLKDEKLQGIIQDRKARKEFANKLFWFLVGFIACVFILLFTSGIECLKFELSDAVLITLLTTTSANIIGIFAFVVRYLFQKQSK